MQSEGWAQHPPQQSAGWPTQEKGPSMQQPLEWKSQPQPSWSQQVPTGSQTSWAPLPGQTQPTPQFGALSREQSIQLLQLQAQQTLSLSACNLQIGLSWDMLPSKKVDLDASCVLFDDIGNVVDSVYYNQLKTADASVLHSGDCRTGELEGDDEQITIDLLHTQPNVRAMAIVINCYSQGFTFRDVETAEARITDVTNQKVLANFSLGCQGNHTALIMGHLYRESPNSWSFKALGIPAEGRTFVDVVPQIHSIMETDSILDPMLRSERISSKSFNLRKGDDFDVPENLTRVMLGLGWDIIDGQTFDLDASCMCFHNFQKVDHCYFKDRKTKDGAIVHSGDNRTGEGEGDDEYIKVDLQKVSKRINTIMFVVTIFDEGKDFSMVTDAYVRLVDASSRDGREICRFSLEQTGQRSAMIMCNLHRYGHSRWKLLAIGEPADGRTFDKLIKKEIIGPFLRKAPPIRKLKVKVHEAKDLAAADSCGTSDPYVFVHFDQAKAKTKVVKKTLAPKWEQELTLEGEETVLEINVYDKDRFSKDDFLGRVWIEFADDQHVHMQPTWYQLRPRGKTSDVPVKGSILISVTQV